MKAYIFGISILAFAFVLMLGIASPQSVPDVQNRRKFNSPRWLEVASSPILLFEPEDNTVNLTARQVGPGNIVRYDLGCILTNPSGEIVTKRVGGVTLDFPRDRLVRMGLTRRMIEQHAANACAGGEHMAIVSVKYADGATWTAASEAK